VVYTKNVVFILSAILAAAAGVLKAHLTRTIDPSDYGFNAAVEILTFAVLGGTTTLIGPIVGGFLLTALPEMLRGLKDYRTIVNGVILLAVIIYLPGGLANPSFWYRLFNRLRGIRKPVNTGDANA
jgi:branched-chain amino acid transport system permease protein